MFGRQEYREINGNLNRQLEEKQVLIAVHRGTWGGNVIQNTIQAYRIALDMGGDIFECDAALSADGVFYAFHDGTEPINLGREENLTTLPSQEIDKLVCINSAYGPSGVHVEKLEDVLQAFTHGELFNIDRAWEHLPQLDALLARYPHVLGQALVKTPVREEYLEFFRRCPRNTCTWPLSAQRRKRGRRWGTPASTWWAWSSKHPPPRTRCTRMRPSVPPRRQGRLCGPTPSNCGPPRWEACSPA